MMSIELKDLWTAASVILGFQIAAFSWRINREIEMEKRGELVWLPAADILNLVSMIVLILGVFVLPTLNLMPLVGANRLFGYSLILLACYPFALAGHYKLYHQEINPETGEPIEQPRYYMPRQEIIVFCVLGLVSLVYLILAVR